MADTYSRLIGLDRVLETLNVGDMVQWPAGAVFNAILEEAQQYNDPVIAVIEPLVDEGNGYVRKTKAGTLRVLVQQMMAVVPPQSI